MKKLLDITFVVFCMCNIAYLIETYQTMTVGSFVLDLFFVVTMSSALTIRCVNFINIVAKKYQEEVK